MAALPISRLLDLDEVPDARLGTDIGLGPQPRKRAHYGALGDARALDMGKRPDRHVVADSDAGTEDDVGLDHDVAAETGIEGEDHGVGIDECRTALHRPIAQVLLHERFRHGQIASRVDPHQFLGRPFDNRTTESAPVREPDDVGEIVLALGVILLHRRHEISERVRIDGHDARVAEPDATFCGRCIVRLDDRFEIALGPDDDTAIGGGISRTHGENRERATGMRLEQAGERGRRHERGVGIKDQNVAREVPESAACRLDGIRGPRAAGPARPGSPKATAPRPRPCPHRRRSPSGPARARLRSRPNTPPSGARRSG